VYRNIASGVFKVLKATRPTVVGIHVNVVAKFVDICRIIPESHNTSQQGLKTILLLKGNIVAAT